MGQKAAVGRRERGAFAREKDVVVASWEDARKMKEKQVESGTEEVGFEGRACGRHKRTSTFLR